MKTYQDLIEAGASDEMRMKFIEQAINEYKASDEYAWALDADAYARQMNTTIMRYQKILYTISGAAVPDNFAANHKCASNFFSRFVTQENQYLLGNGAQFGNEKTKDVLGGPDFDTKLQKAGKYALIHRVSYTLFNMDHVDVFSALEFCPLWDEETGALKAGIRFWQIDAKKPLRCTLYELDGYTDYIKKKGQEMEIFNAKRAYKQNVVTSVIDGEEIFDGENYPTFPVVPLWGNPNHQSELVGLKGEIDAYDLIKSGFANDLDDASMIYWTLENCGGMDDVDLAKFLERMKVVKAAVVEGDENGAKAEAHTIEVPYQSRETYLTRLETDMYNDAMALNVNQISAGNVTATAIMAAYEPLNNKTDQFEYEVQEFMKRLLAVAGIEDTVTFKRSRVSNQLEETQMVLSAAQYLDDRTILQHLPFISPDEVEAILDNLTDEEAQRYAELEKENEELKAQNGSVVANIGQNGANGSEEDETSIEG